MVRYATRDDVSLRLHDSIVRYKGEYSYVVLGDGLTLLVYKCIPSGISKTYEEVDANSEDLEVASPPLGYAQIKENAAYLSRPPYRRQKQGVANNSVVAIYPFTEGIHDNPCRITDPYFSKMLLGIYPSVTEAWKEVLTRAKAKDKYCSRAFSTDFAFASNSVGDSYLFFQGEKVGTVDGDPEKPVVTLLGLWKLNSILQADLEKLGIEVNYA